MSPKKKKRKKVKPARSSFVNQLKARKAKQAFDFSKELDLATWYYQNGKLKQAEEIYRRIVSVDPENVTGLYGLGIILPHFGQIDQGIQSIRKALELDPRFAAGHNSLGVLLIEKGDFQKAATHFNKAIAIQPDHAMAYNNLGNALNEQGQFEDAKVQFQKALSIKNDYAEAHSNLGNVFKELGDLDRAEKCYRKALAIQPGSAEVFHSLSQVYKIQGDSQKAVNNLHKALELRPEMAQVHRSLSRTRKYTPGDEHIEEMEKLYSLPTIPDDQKMHLAFALGKAYEDCHQFDKAITCLDEGNRLKRKTYNYSIETEEQHFKAIKDHFSSSRIAQFTETGDPDRTPIFILGMPRSGTSLVEQILASHPHVYGAGELNDLKNILYKLTDTRLPEKALEKFLQGGKKTFVRFASGYVKKIRQYSPETPNITDKMPHNFLFIGAIRLALPSAKIIHCVRDPMDNCFSIYKNFFAGRHEYAYELEELGQYYLLYKDLMLHWHNVFPGFIYDLSYENLVNDQEAEIRKLIEYTGLEWDDHCLSFHKTSRNVATLSAEQVRKPIYKDSVRLWKQYENHLQPLQTILSSSSSVQNS